MTRLRKITAVLVAVVMLFCMMFQTVSASTGTDGFSDVQGHWAEASILKWADKGVISGDMGLFRPDSGITRAEFCTAINKLLGFSEKSDVNFSDVEAGAWYAAQTAIAKEAGYITGYGNNILGPDDKLTRQDAAFILKTVLKLDDSAAQSAAAFDDSEEITSYAKDAVAVLNAKGYMTGYDNHFHPKKGITRAELISILDRAVKQFYPVEGTYSEADVDGSVIVGAGGTVLKDTVISGNLYLSEGIGQGNVTLSNVTVKGKTFVNGGGENSIVLENAALGDIVIEKKDGKVRIVAKGTTTVANVQLNSGAKLEEEGLSGGGFGKVEIIEVASGQQIVLDGDFVSVDIQVPGVSVQVAGGTVSSLNIASGAAGSSVQIAQGATIGTLTANAAVTVSGQGKITTANINASDVVIGPKPSNTNIAPGITANIGGAQTGPGGSSGGTGNSGNNGGNPPPAQSDWTMVWNDEFSGTTLDDTKWRLENFGDGFGNLEKQYYKPENAVIEDGKLVIEAKKESYKGCDYTSAKLFSKADWKYGKFEARIKLPLGQGFWPAFWMMPTDGVYGGWAASGEIDIMEAKGRIPDEAYGTLHYGGAWPNNTHSLGGEKYKFSVGQTIEQFHTYSVEWEPGEFRWYVDGNLYKTQNDWDTQNDDKEKFAYPAPFDQKFYLMLNLAIGGNFDGGLVPEDSMFPTHMEVDYVRVYELTGRPYKTPVEQVVSIDPLPEGARQPDATGNLVNDVDYSMGIRDNAEGVDAEFGSGWNFVHNANFGGVATTTVDTIDGKKYAKINVTNRGAQPYSLQLEQLTTLGKGRWYKFSFDAKADKTRTLGADLSGGPTAGWGKYSGAYTENLTTDFKHFEHKFKMSGSSDILTRIEFNCGTDTGPVWIGNVRVEEIDPPDNDLNASKNPLPASGNRVSNGAFDKRTMDRLAYWNVTKSGAAAEVKVPENTRELTIDITDGGASTDALTVDQKGIQLENGIEYRLTFRARAAAGRSIEVKIVSKDGAISYLAGQQITLTEAMQTFAIPFNMEAATDNESQLVFMLGGNDKDVYIDDVSLISTTKNYSGVDLYPLKNGDFILGLNRWETYAIEGGVANFSVVNGEAKIAITNLGTPPHSIMFNQGNMQFSRGMEYVLSFDARASVNRDIRVTLENEDNLRLFDTGLLQLTTESNKFSYVFNITADEILALKFLMGNTADAEIGDVYIDNVVLEVKDAPVKRPPSFALDSTNNRVGQPVDLVFGENEEWREAVQKIEVDGEELASEKYTLAVGTLAIAADVFTAAKSYNIVIKAEGYADVKITQDILANDGNLVKNGDMSQGESNWSLWYGDGGAATFNVEDGTAKIDISGKGPNNWSIQFLQNGVQVEKDKNYELSLKAWSTVERPIQVEFTGYKGNESVKFNITSDEAAVYKYYLTVPASDTAFKLNFLIGNVTNGSYVTPAGAHTLYIDDVSIKEVVVENAPALTADTTDNLTGKDIDITFTDDADWREAITAVKVDGAKLAEGSYDISEGNLKIDADQFPAARDYTIVVEAEGYYSAQVLQTIRSGKVWEEVGENLIVDGTFTTTTTFGAIWLTHNQGQYDQWAGMANFEVVEGVAKAIVTQVGWEWWHIQLFQNGVAVPAGAYKISFDMRSEAERPVYVELTDSGAPRQSFTVDDTMKTYEAIINVTTGGSFKFMFGLGRDGSDQTLSVPYNIFIDNVKLIEVKEKAPVLSADITNNTVGQDITITFADNEDWRNAISKVKVNATIVDESMYTTGSGIIVIDAGKFPIAGNYTITIEADGFAGATLVQAIEAPWVEVGENLIVDGTFTTTTIGAIWLTHNQGQYEQWAGMANFEVTGGVVKATVTQVGWEWWHIQLFQNGVAVPAGTYEISFDMRSETERPVYVELTDSGAPRQSFTVDDTMKTYDAIINVTTGGSYKFMFGLGRDSSDQTLSTPYDVYIDNVKLVEVTR